MPNLTCATCGHSGPDVGVRRNFQGKEAIRCVDEMACWWRWDTRHRFTTMSLAEFRDFYSNALKGEVPA